MLKVSEKDRKFLIENIENAETLLAGNDLNALLDPLSDYLAYIWFDENWELTDEGRKVQAIYDRIYFNN